jgi:hypothetical protein
MLPAGRPRIDRSTVATSGRSRTAIRAIRLASPTDVSYEVRAGSGSTT